MIKDLDKCLEGLKDERQYDLFGKGYMMQNQKCLHLERAANYDMDYGTQMCYNNISKATAYEAFQRSDSMDSCDGDFFDGRRSPSPVRSEFVVAYSDQLIKAPLHSTVISPPQEIAKKIHFEITGAIS